MDIGPFFEPLRRRLHQLLRRRGHSRPDAEDLIQDAFMRLHVYCKTVHVDSLEALAVRTVLNQAVSAHRESQGHLFVDQPIEDLDLAANSPAPEEIYAADQKLDRIKAALDAVGPRTRDMFLMHRLWGFSYAEIAQELGVTVAAVERRIARAMQAISVEIRGE